MKTDISNHRDEKKARQKYRKCDKDVVISIFVPSSFDFDSHALKFPCPPCVTRDRIHYFLNLILRLPTLNYDYIDAHGFVTLNAKKMQRNFKNYKEILNYMMQSGIIVCRPWYKTSLQSKGYKIASEFADVDIKRVFVTEAAVRRIIWCERLPPENDPYPFFTSSLNALQINEALLRRYIDWDYKRKKLNPGLIEKKKKKFILLDGSVVWKYVHVDIDQQKQSGLILLEEILECKRNGIGFRTIVDDAGGRFHHPITRMKKEHRNMVTWNHQKMVGYDIGCSQFFLLSRLFDIDFWTGSKENGRITLEDLPAKFASDFNLTPAIGNKRKVKNFASGNLLETIKCVLQKIGSISIDMKNTVLESRGIDKIVYKSREKYSSLSMLSNCIHQEISESFLFQLHKEVVKFTELAAAGNLYEGYQDLVSQTLSVTITRSQAKDSLCQTIFSSNSFYSQAGAEAKRQFSQVFPAMMEVIKLLKTGKKSDGPHARLPLLLQAIEAEILLNRVRRRVEKECPGMPLIPLHDGLFTIEIFEEDLRRIMQEELLTAIGRYPTLRREEWNEGKVALVLQACCYRAG